MDSRDLFEILVREHADTVRAFLLTAVRDPAAADDLMQESFLIAWKNLDRYDRQLPFGPWIRGIAGKLMLSHRRKMGRSKVYYTDDEALAFLDRSFESFHSLRGDSFDEKLDAMRECLGSLSERRKEAIVLHYEHGLHCKEIAQRLGLGLEVVKKHLQRGRASLLRCIEAKVSTEEMA